MSPGRKKDEEGVLGVKTLSELLTENKVLTE